MKRNIFISGRINQGGLVSTGFRGFIEREVIGWALSKFSNCPPAIYYHAELSPVSPDFFVSCKLEVSIEGEPFQAVSYSSDSTSAIRKCVRRLRIGKNYPEEPLAVDAGGLLAC